MGSLCLLRQGGISAFPECMVLHDRIEHRDDFASDDNLILSCGLDDRDDAVELLDLIGLCLALVLQREAQARDAVLELGDIVLSSDESDQLVAKLAVIHK